MCRIRKLFFANDVLRLHNICYVYIIVCICNTSNQGKIFNPAVKIKIYHLLGLVFQAWVISRIGNPGGVPVFKALAVPVAGVLMNEGMKILEDHGIENRVRTSDESLRTNAELARENNTPLPVDVFVEQAQRNGQMCNAPRVGPIEVIMAETSRSTELVSESLVHLRDVTLETVRNAPLSDVRDSSPDPRQ